MYQGRREDAYIWFREHQDKFSRRERRPIRAVLSGRLWRAPALLAVITLVLQLAAGGIFANQLQDMFSLLGGAFRPYMYVASALPLLVNLVLGVALFIQCYERLVFAFRMFGVRPRLQFDLTGYQANVDPIRVDYLPHSKLVLWISCGEG